MTSKLKEMKDWRPGKNSSSSAKSSSSHSSVTGLGIRGRVVGPQHLSVPLTAPKHPSNHSYRAASSTATAPAPTTAQPTLLAPLPNFATRPPSLRPLGAPAPASPPLRRPRPPQTARLSPRPPSTRTPVDPQLNLRRGLRILRSSSNTMPSRPGCGVSPRRRSRLRRGVRIAWTRRACRRITCLRRLGGGMALMGGLRLRRHTRRQPIAQRSRPLRPRSPVSPRACHPEPTPRPQPTRLSVRSSVMWAVATIS